MENINITFEPINTYKNVDNVAILYDGILIGYELTRTPNPFDFEGNTGFRILETYFPIELKQEMFKILEKNKMSLDVSESWDDANILEISKRLKYDETYPDNIFSIFLELRQLGNHIW